MKKIFVLLAMPLLLFAKVHYAKVESYESVVLKSAVSGLVMDVNLSAEGTTILSQKIIHIDDKLDLVNLQNSKKTLALLENMVKINQDISVALKETVQRQKNYYERLSKISTASKVQKDNAHNSYTSAKTQYLSTLEKIINLKKQILDMNYKQAQLKDSILKKSIILDHKYLYRLMVRKGDFVAPGSPLAMIDDASRAKLVLYLEPKELENLKEKNIYIDDKKTSYKIDKVWKMTDEKFISSYRAEIYIPAPKGLFSKLLKVEIK